MSTAHLAIDLGASSGRAIVGVLEGEPARLRLHEAHRFEHVGCPTPAGPVWDLTGIWNHLLTGIRHAVAWCDAEGVELASVGVDTWGVDWVLVGKSGEVLGLPHCYRDPQNDAASEQVVTKLGGFERLYERTGIQRMAFNTLFQIAARQTAEPRLFDAAERLLFLPDLFHYWLSGEMATERTIASTSSMLDVNSGEWDLALFEELDLPTHVLGEMVEPGAVIGTLRSEIAAATGAPTSMQVIAPAAHDTASAVAAAPATGDANWAYLSSGTWSLLGAEITAPLITDASRTAPFTHERGVGGSIRFLKNIAGLWLVQQLREECLENGERLDHAELARLAEAAEPFRTLIDTAAAPFLQPGDMVGKIQKYALETEQPVPETTGQLVRCCLESLALCYRQTLQQLETILGKRIDVLHIVGGGIQNRLLNSLAAQITERRVACGPVEATAIGNLLVQAQGCGMIGDAQELRITVRRSFDVEEITSPGPLPQDVVNRYADLVGRA